MNLTEEMQIVDRYSKIDDAVARIAHLREAVGSALDIAVDFHGRVHAPMAKDTDPRDRTLFTPIH